MSKIYDCFTFFDEFDILELRLEELNSVVDYFVLCEASETFVGDQKELHFIKEKERYQKFLDKIIYVKVDDFPDKNNVWVREEHQREAMLRGIVNASADDLIIFSDVDEIPRADQISLVKNFEGYIQFKMDMFQYFLNLRERKNSWNSCYALKKKFISSLDCSPEGTKSLSYARFHLEQISSHTSIPILPVDNGGWHFTHLGGVERLMRKFNSYSHANDPWPSKMKNINTLKSQIALGVAIWSGDRLAEYIPIDDSYPEYIQKNVSFYKNLGYIKDIYESFKDLQKMHVSLKREFCFSILNKREPSVFLGDMNSLQYIDLADLQKPNLEYLSIPGRKGLNISADKMATQSSISEWSIYKNCDQDASNALKHPPSGRYKFHTNWENQPWWQVDLENNVEINSIVIFNRIIPYDQSGYMINRSKNIIVSISSDGKNYNVIHDNRGKKPFGGIDGDPLVIISKSKYIARYVKIHLPEEGVLHLDSIEIYS